MQKKARRERDTVNIALPRELHERVKKLADERGWLLHGVIQAALDKLEMRGYKTSVKLGSGAF